MIREGSLLDSILYCLVCSFFFIVWFAFGIAPLVLGIVLSFINPYLAWLCLGFLFTVPVDTGILMYVIEN